MLSKMNTNLFPCEVSSAFRGMLLPGLKCTVWDIAINALMGDIEAARLIKDIDMLGLIIRVDLCEPFNSTWRFYRSLGGGVKLFDVSGYWLAERSPLFRSALVRCKLST